MTPAVKDHLALQSGLISRKQALDAGLEQHDLRRLVRRREWSVVHPGVYVDHTGTLTWLQRAWAAVLFSWPAALWGDSALRAADGPGSKDHDESTVHVAVDRHRSTLNAPDGVRIHHVTGLDAKVLSNMSPPRMRYEEAALDVALAASGELAVVAALSKACQTRRTTARRLRVALTSRSRVARREWIDEVLTDVAEGTCSALEHGYLMHVERAHGLVPAQRQVRATASMGVVYRDAQYGDEFVVELDGRLVHDNPTQRDADFERDLDAAAGGQATVRLSWGQVFDRPCSTAAKLVLVLRAHDVSVAPQACAPGCPVGGLGQVA